MATRLALPVVRVPYGRGWRSTAWAGWTVTSRPAVGVASGDAAAAVDAFARGLQAGHDQRDADVLNHQFAADVVWGSPYGALVDGYDELHPIHIRLQSKAVTGRHSATRSGMCWLSVTTWSSPTSPGSPSTRTASRCRRPPTPGGPSRRWRCMCSSDAEANGGSPAARTPRSAREEPSPRPPERHRAILVIQDKARLSYRGSSARVPIGPERLRRVVRRLCELRYGSLGANAELRTSTLTTPSKP